MAKSYVLEFPGWRADKRAIVDQYVMPQPTCAGACLFVVWSAIEKSQGNCDWSAIDARLATWTAAGKQCALIVWGISDAKPNVSTPGWVIADPAYQSVTCSYYGNMPIPYAGAYPTYYRQFIQQLLAKYGSSSAIARIRFGWGVGGETYPPCYNNLKGHQPADQFDQTWQNYVADGMTFASAEPHTVLLDVACNAYGNPPRLPVCDFIAKTASGLTPPWCFGTQGLSQADITAHAAGHPTNADWLENFGHYRSSPTHLQTATATDPTNAAGGTGSLNTLAPFALQHGCESFEVYLQDWQVAYDPAYATYAAYSAAYQAAFEQIAAY